MKKFTSAFAAAAMTTAFAMQAMAAPASPTVHPGEFYCFPGMPAEMINYLPVPENSNAPKVSRLQKLDNPKYDNTDGHNLREIQTEGNYRVLVLLVEFQDYKFSQTTDPQVLITDMLNGENFTFQGATGSANAYYRRISHGKFNPIFDVYGPVSLSKKEVEYVVTNPDDKYVDANGNSVECWQPGRMVEEAINLLDDKIDYSKYDADGDGFMDFVYIFHAGQGATTGGNSKTTVWPHAFTLTSAIGGPIEHDGVKINRYCTSSELGSDQRLTGIGTFVHEFAHVLGLPDLYDTANNNGQPSKCFTPGSFDCMDAGNYNNNHHTPACFSAYEQYSLEWMKPCDLTGSANITMLPLESHPFAYKVPSTNNPKEYFILENRGNSFQDRFLEAHGLLVWHIDFDLGIWNANTANNNELHQRIDIVEADNQLSAATRFGDTFPGFNNVCEFKSNVTPSFRDWSGKGVGYELSEIQHNFDGTTTFKVNATNGKTLENSDLAAPAARIIAASKDALEIEWPEVKGATGYFVSIFKSAALDGSVLPYEAYANGYYFKKLSETELNGDFLYATLSGLEPNTDYSVMLYAINDANASRMEAPVSATTVDASENFSAARTNIHLSGDQQNAFLDWDAVEGADSYQLAIVTRAPGAKADEFNYDFEGTRLPEGWSGNGKFESRNKFYGQAAPSYKLSSIGSYLQTPSFERQISQLSFWSRKRYDDDQAYLDIYAVGKDGVKTKVTTISTLTTAGNTFTVDMPAGAYAVRFIYRYAVTDLDCNIDDIKLTLVDNFTDTPVNATIESTSDTSAMVSGLEKGKDYIAYVTPAKAGEDGARSNEVAFRLENLAPSGVEEIITDASAAFAIDGFTILPADADCAYNIYTIDGIIVASAVKGAFTLPARGFYLISINGATAKVHI